MAKSIGSPNKAPKAKAEPKARAETKSLRDSTKTSQQATAVPEDFTQPGQVDLSVTSVTNPPEQGVGTAVSQSSTALLLSGEVHLRASSEPPLPRHFPGHLGIPSRSPSSSPRPQGRESTSRTVFEWEQAQSRRAALYSEIPDRGRSHQDSSAVNALVFGQRRTRPGSVDPGLEEERIRPGSIMDQPRAAGMPVSVRFREGLRAVQRSLTPQPSNAVLMGEASAPTQNFVLKNAKRNVPQISKGDSGTVGEVVFGDAAKAPDHPEVLRIVWGGCAGQPSSREEGRKKATPPFATLWDLKGYAGYAGLVSQSSTLSSSLPASPISEASEPTRRSGIRLIQGASESHYQIQEASPHWHLEQKSKGDADVDRLSTYRSLYEGRAGRSTWTDSVSRKLNCERSSRGHVSDESSEVQASSLQQDAERNGAERCRVRKQFPSKPTTQASLISLATDPETGRKIREEAEAWNKIFESSAGRLTHREERRGVKSVASSVPSTKDLLTPSPEPLPSPRPRATAEEGGGAPWERRDSVSRLDARGRLIKAILRSWTC